MSKSGYAAPVAIAAVAAAAFLIAGDDSAKAAPAPKPQAQPCTGQPAQDQPLRSLECTVIEALKPLRL